MKGKIKMIFFPLLSFVLCFSLTAAVYAASLVNRFGKIQKEPDGHTDAVESFDIDTQKADTIRTDDIVFAMPSVIQPSENVVNILLVGRDVKDKDEVSDTGRTDTMIVASLNRKQKRISMISLMRDCYVQIPGYSNNKLNAAYAFGGYQLLDETIEQNFGIRIDYNIGVNFSSFIDIINMLGGIDVELTQEEADYILMKVGKENGLQEGMNHLTGRQAMWYARTRKIGTGSESNDFGRTYRQRTILQTLYTEVIRLPMSEIINILYEVADDIETDMDIGDMAALGTEVYGMGLTSVKMHRIPEDGMYTNEVINRMQVLVVDFQDAQEKLNEWIYL